MKQKPVFFFEKPVIAASLPKSWGRVNNNTFESTLIDKIENLTHFKYSKWVLAEQIHGSKVILVNKKASLLVPIEGVDGLISNSPNHLLVVKHADCIPIFLLDKEKKVIGLVHSGWRGTIGKIGLVALHKMMAKFGSRVEDVVVGLGPGARACCYRKKKGSIFSQLPEWQEFIKDNDGRLAVDLVGFIKQMFVEAGVKQSQISDCGICSIDDKSFWSYTRHRDQEEEPGMGVSVLGLKGK